jgi:uncharacterized membrane protein YhaH (DUF805 family)
MATVNETKEEIMGSLSIWHVIVLLFWAAIFVVPVWRIVAKAGYPGVLSLLAFVPLVNVVLLWLFAFVAWPVEKKAGKQS